MEKLTEQQRANVSKMSDARLRSKLAAAGYNPDDLAELDRSALVGAWVDLLAEPGVAGGEVAEVEEVEEVEITLEERRLMLEEKRLVEQRLQREEQRLQREEQRLQREQEERRWAREMELKERELELNRLRAEQEESQRSSTVSKLKLWGDALRNTITRMPNEPVNVISWFICLERLFEQLQVPADLRAVLMRPYLSERAKTLLARCDVARAADYSAIKRYLLQEMRLSSSVYLDKFNSVTRDNTETFHQFSLRLLSLFEFYVESRKIDESYTKLLELVVYDRIKSVLPQFLAKHVLALESAHKDGWLGRQALVEALDAYMASSTPDGRARVAAIGHPKPEPQFKQSSQIVEAQAGAKSAPVTPVPTPRVRKCYICDSPNHIQAACPQRPPYFNRRSNFAKNKPVPQPRVSACMSACVHENAETAVMPAEAARSRDSRDGRGDQLSAEQSAGSART